MTIVFLSTPLIKAIIKAMYQSSGLSANHTVADAIRKAASAIEMVRPLTKRNIGWASGVAFDNSLSGIATDGSGVYTVWTTDKSVESAIASGENSKGSYWEGQRFTNIDGFFYPSQGAANMPIPDGKYLVSAHATFKNSSGSQRAALGLRLTGETEDDVIDKQRFSHASGNTSDQEFFLSISRVLELTSSRGVAFTTANSEIAMSKLNFTITPV